MPKLSTKLNYTLGVQNMLRSISLGNPENNPRIIKWVDKEYRELDSYVDENGLSHYIDYSDVKSIGRYKNSGAQIDKKSVLLMDDNNNFCQISEEIVKSYVNNYKVNVYRVDMFPINKDEYFYISADLMSKIMNLPVERHVLDVERNSISSRIDFSLDGRIMEHNIKAPKEDIIDCYYDACIEMTPYAIMFRNDEYYRDNSNLLGSLEISMQNEVEFADDNKWYDVKDYQKLGISAMVDKHYIMETDDYDSINRTAFSMLQELNQTKKIVEFSNLNELSDYDMLNFLAQKFQKFTTDDLQLGHKIFDVYMTEETSCRHKYLEESTDNIRAKAVENTLIATSGMYPDKTRNELEDLLNLSFDWDFYSDFYKDVYGFRPKEFPPYADMNIEYNQISVDKKINDETKYLYYKLNPNEEIRRISLIEGENQNLLVEEMRDLDFGWNIVSKSSTNQNTLKSAVNAMYADKVRFSENKEDVVPTLVDDKFTLDLEAEGINWKRNLDALSLEDNIESDEKTDESKDILE